MDIRAILSKDRAIDRIVLYAAFLSAGIIAVQAWHLIRLGGMFWVILLLVLLGIIGFLCYVIHDISKNVNQKRGQTDFVNNLSHEFKTPLTSIQLAADVLKNPNIVNHPQRLLNYATIISTESAHLCAKVERMLQMAELEDEKVLLNKTSFDWKDLLNETIEMYSTTVGTKGGTISLKVPEESLIWQGDTLHMKNAIGNIIDNSIKYNVMAPVVCIGVKTEAGKVAITITDNGIGIDKEHQRLLFDKFYRVPTGNIHDVKGLGLGLNYVSLILKAHGGEVSCTSDLGKGSIFTLTFPYQS